MGRWRAPAAASSALITAAGQRRLRDEFDGLWKQRPEVVTALTAAAAEGDRSENAEYTYRKKQLGEIDRRIRYLGKRLDVLKVVDAPPTDPSRIYFGARFTIEDDAGKRHHHRIVGPDETDAAAGWISIDSPLARALLGKRCDEEIEVVLPTGTGRFSVVEVAYETA